MSTAITIPIYDHTIALLPVSGNTPYGYYDTDLQFINDAQRFVVFATRKLGYPIMEIQLQDINFYSAYEDAVTTYGRELHEYRIRENYLAFEGNPTGSVLNDVLIQPSLGAMIRIAEAYGVEAGSGGNVNYYTGSINLEYGRQLYDLDMWASQSGVVQDGDRIEVKRVFYEAPPAIIRYFDPYAGTGTGLQSLMETFGFGQFSPGINFMLMPMYFDTLKIQAIEFNDQIRKSSFSFELINNKLRVFPIPSFEKKLYFNYIKKSERDSVIRRDGNGNPITNSINDTSKVPFVVPTYNNINSVFKKWIMDYAFAIIKETLGIVRSTYSTIPIPDAEVTMNGDALMNQAREEQRFLLEQLRATLDETSRQKQLERKKMENDALRSNLNDVPMTIYIF